GRHPLWRRRRHLHDDHVRARTPRVAVRAWLRRRVRAVQRLRLPVGCLAVRCGGAHLGRCRRAPLAAHRTRLTFDPARSLTVGSWLATRSARPPSAAGSVPRPCATTRTSTWSARRGGPRPATGSTTTPRWT